MKVWTFLAFVFVMACSPIFAQTPPPVADNANPQDRGIKDRSIEMERVKREENKNVVTGKPGEAMAESKFNQIKEDFEQIQLSQSAIVAAYSKSKNIDYKLISMGSEQITQRGTRLSENLFAPPPPQKNEKKKKDKKEEVVNEAVAAPLPLPSDIKSLISEMDNTLVLFVANPMFTNSRVLNAADQADAKSKLDYIIRLSRKLHELARANVTTPSE
jgi:hypothetical protein